MIKPETKTIWLRAKVSQKRRAKGRRVLRNKALKWYRNNPAPTHEKKACVDCLKDCTDPGACCRIIVIWHKGNPWPTAETIDEAQRMLDEHEQGYPFEITGFARLAQGEPMWYLRCKMLTAEGRCGIYDYRPELCRSFVPGCDPLCAMDPTGENARSRYFSAMQPIIEEGTQPEGGGDAV